MNQVFFLRREEHFIQLVFDFFTSQINDPIYFNSIKERCGNVGLLESQGDNLKDTQNGFFTSLTFSYYASTYGLLPQGQGVKISLVEQILSILADLSIINKIPPYSPFNRRPMYHASTGIPKWYQESGCLFNRIFGFDYIADKYAGSVFKISALRDQDYDIGTGFVIKSNGKSFLLTNRHVVEGADRIAVFNGDDMEQEVGECIFDTKNDLAIIPFKDILPINHFKLHKQLQILGEIITIGYPPVAQSKFSSALFHKGEINSFIEDYWGGKLFLFSAKTNPGNSGSPIIDEYGTVVGIVTKQLEHQDGIFNGKLPYYAGIPSSEILSFIENLA